MTTSKTSSAAATATTTKFNLKKAKNAQRVGPIQINVSKTDPKKSKYTILVFADDKQIEKRARLPANCSVLRRRHSRPAYEIVVFNVGKDQITDTFRRKGRRLRSCGRSGRS